MAPLSHIYISTQATDRKTDLLVFGSVLPDIRQASKDKIFSKFHDNPKEFFDFIQSNHPDLKDLGLGVLLHGNVFKGADFYSDNYEAYFKKIGEKYLLDDVFKISGIEDKKALIVFAHNFIEAAFDLLLRDSHTELLEFYKGCFKNCDFDKISFCVSDYLKIDKEIVKKVIFAFEKTYSPDNFLSDEIFCQKTIVPFIWNLLNKKVENGEVLEIVKKSKELVRDEYLDVLDNAVKEIREDFNNFI